MRKSSDYDLYLLSKERPIILQEVADKLAEEISTEIATLTAEAAQLAAEIESLTGSADHFEQNLGGEIANRLRFTSLVTEQKNSRMMVARCMENPSPKVGADIASAAGKQRNGKSILQRALVIICCHSS
jgi:hypothetical protein